MSFFIYAKGKNKSGKVERERKNGKKESKNVERTLRMIARDAKKRIKNGFWNECKEKKASSLIEAKKMGLNESKAERYFMGRVSETVNGKKPEDEFYLRVKEMLERDGEVSDAIGRLTDKPYYDSLSYEEKQRYTLSLSERYLRALERYKRELEFSGLNA